MGLKHAHQVFERSTRVNDVLDDEHMTSFDIAADVHDKANSAAGHVAIFIARYSDEFDRARYGQLPGQICKKNEGAFQHANENEVALVLVIR